MIYVWSWLMEESWFDRMDEWGESPMSRLLKSGHASASILTGMILTLETADEASDPPIHRAAREGDVRGVRELIEQGADVDELNGEGLTPLYWASLNGSIDLAKLLINRGANVNAIDSVQTGLSPLALAKIMGYAGIEMLLIEHGAAF